MIGAVYIILGLLILVLGYGWFIEPASLVVKEHSIPVDPTKIKMPIRILFLSDIHTGFFSSQATIIKALAVAQRSHQENPYDLVLWGGDFVHNNAKYLQSATEIAQVVGAWKVPMYGVLGNHDHRAPQGVDTIVSGLNDAGITMLVNETAVIKVRGDRLLLVGIDDLQSLKDYLANPKKHYRRISEYRKRAEKSDFLKQFDAVEPDLPRILISHNPDAVYLPREIAPVAVLSGHTHGGQFWPLTWIGERIHRVMPTGSFVTWAGERLLNRTVLLVSRGVGGSFIPFRLFCRPDVLAITLVPTETSKRLVIGLSGKPRSGKDTVASLLLTLFPRLVPLTIGNAVKEEYDALHGTDTLHSHEEKFAHRNGINELGAKQRAKDLYYWVKKTVKHDPPLMITDVRQLHEATTVKEAGGIMIRIEADFETLRRRMGSHAKFLKEHFNHEQESHLDNYQEWDYVIHNDGSMEELEHKVREICQDIRNRSTQ